MRRVMLAAAGWVGAALVAALVGLLALTLLRGGVGGGGTHAVSQHAAAQALARAERESPNGSPSGRPTASPSSAAPAPSRSTEPPGRSRSSTSSSSPTPSRSSGGSAGSSGSSGRSGTDSGAVTRALDSVGGTVVARCERDRVQLLSWTPRQGFEADDATGGARRTAYLKFESDDVDVRVSVDCRRGTPVAHLVTERDD